VSARGRILVERVLAGMTGVMGVVTIFWRTWIETLFGWDPDHANGSVEWLIIAGLFAACAAFSLLSRVEVRRLAEAQAQA
jgi:hypothetical protein